MQLQLIVLIHLVVARPLHVVIIAALSHFVHLVVIVTPFVLLSLSVKVVSHLTPSPIIVRGHVLVELPLMHKLRSLPLKII